MRLVHIKYPVSGGEHHLVILGQDHRLEHVGHLGYVGHLDAVAVLVEYVE